MLFALVFYPPPHQNPFSHMRNDRRCRAAVFNHWCARNCSGVRWEGEKVGKLPYQNQVLSKHTWLVK